MKKIITTFFAITAISAIGQTSTIKGQIHDKENNAIPFAAVVLQKGNTNYADKNGAFSIEANKGDTIFISAIGYNNATAVITKQQTVDILLEKDKSAATSDLDVKGKKQSSDDPTMHTQFEKDQIAYSLNNVGSTLASLPVIHQKDETQGSPYLFSKWATGYVINASGAKIVNDSYLFNFDKLSQNLLMTQDKTNSIEVDKAIIKSFTLNTGNKEYVFENREINNSQQLFQVLTKGKNYTLYKINATKFERSNYVSTGLTESGHNYDLYVDKPIYYIFSLASAQLRQLDIKKKSLKNAFPKEQAKVDAYFSENADEKVNEDFVIGLIESLN